MPNVRSSTGILCKMITSQSVLIRLITFLYLNARVYDGHHIKTHPLHLPQHPLYIGILATPGEHFIVVHVVNVTHNNIGRQLLFTEGLGDCQQLFLIVIPPSGLLKTQAPQRWHGGSAREVGVVVDDTGNGVSAKEIVIHLAIIRPKVKQFFIGTTPKVEVRLIAIIEEDSIG